MIYFQGIFIFAGCFFFVVGTLGLLRFPDVYSRIHAITKADNLGLGLVIIGLLPSATHLSQGAKMLLIWFLVLAASATASYLIAHYVREHDPHQEHSNAPVPGDEHPKDSLSARERNP